jgi:electron transfer flavoprotein alpha subunit
MTQYDVFVAPATTMGKSLAPRIAALLDVMQISDVVSVEGERTFKRPIYAGNAIPTIRSNDPKLVLTVRPSAFPMAPDGSGKSAVRQISENEGVHRIRLLNCERRTSSRPELGSAKIVVSGGRALQSSDQFQAIIEPLADKLGAAVGASRAVVDAGWLPYNYQVGQTGKAVAPQIYFAIGISGAIQHLAGMRESKIIVAINKDADAPIFGVADIGLVADIFEAVPELTSKL